MRKSRKSRSDERFSVVYDSVSDRFVLLNDDALPRPLAATRDVEVVTAPEPTIFDAATPSSPLPQLDVATLAVCNDTPSISDTTLESTASRVKGATTTAATGSITWCGEPLHVSVACVSRVETQSDSDNSDDIEGNAEPVSTNASATMMQHVFELAQLERIRPFADGFRIVNTDCTFAALPSPLSVSSSSSSSSSSDEPLPRSDNDESLLPVFYRGDAVLVRRDPQNCHRRFRGIVTRRVRHSSLYDIKTASGMRVRAVSARCMQLLHQPAPRRVVHDFARGDWVLWLPATDNSDSNNDDASDSASSSEGDSDRLPRERYKARVLRRHAHERVDIELRTGRVYTNVPCRELRFVQ